MKARSDIIPKSVVVDKIGNQAHISLSTNVEKIDDGYEYDYYFITVDWREELEQEIENAFEVWVVYAQKERLERPSIEERISALEQIELERLFYD